MEIQQRKGSVMKFLFTAFRHLPELLRLDTQSRHEGISLPDRRADWWGKLASLEAKRTGAWS
jgi:hypothetical protein